MATLSGTPSINFPYLEGRIRFAVINDALSPNNTIVAAVTNKKIRVISVFLVAAGAVSARWESNAAGAALSGVMELAANTGFTLPYNHSGWFETVAGQLLNLELSTTVSVDGHLSYIEV